MDLALLQTRRSAWVWFGAKWTRAACPKAGARVVATEVEWEAVAECREVAVGDSVVTVERGVVVRVIAVDSKPPRNRKSG